MPPNRSPLDVVETHTFLKKNVQIDRKAMPLESKKERLCD
jgi:hypothetical protein